MKTKRIPEYYYKGEFVIVMVIEPNGVWAMVRKPGAMPFCVRVRELEDCGSTATKEPFCPNCGTTTMWHAGDCPANPNNRGIPIWTEQ